MTGKRLPVILFRMTFNGTRLYQRRLGANMSRADLAAAVRSCSGGQIKASEAGIRGWEKGKHTPGGEAIMAIAQALDCPAKELYGEDEDEEAAPMSSLDMAVALAEHAAQVAEFAKLLATGRAA